MTGDDMRPTLELLSTDTVERVLDEAFALLRDPGIKVQAPAALALLEAGGAAVDGERASLPEGLVRDALATVPHAFDLYDRDGRPAVRYGQGVVQFDPGSSGVRVLDPDTLEPRTSEAADLIRLVKVAEGLPQYDAQSTAIVCHDVPADIGDLYRLFVVLLYSRKPVVTGAFRVPTLGAMIELLAIDAGGPEALAARPRAVFDVCSSPPLTWADLGGQNLIDLARARVPAELISMPIAGAAAPVTLIGSVVQHAAETLSGIVIHQLAGPGAPIVWGGAPAILDMRSGATAMGAVETAMIDAAYAQVGHSLGLPTHAYLCATDAKVVDAQAGLESGISASIGALAGIDLISGAGMLAFLLTQSAEKLVVDADAIGMAKRLARGIGLPTETLALGAFGALADAGSFLELPETRRLFRGEQFLPSPVLDRRSHRAWAEDGALDAFGRARARAESLVEAYERPTIEGAVEARMVELIREAARDSGVELATLPGLPEAVTA
jgi:trimethylamine--corrinoid protein Co-methyltransferase